MNSWEWTASHRVHTPHTKHMHAQLHNASFLPGELQSAFHKYSHSLAEGLHACGVGGTLSRSGPLIFPWVLLLRQPTLSQPAGVSAGTQPTGASKALTNVHPKISRPFTGIKGNTVGPGDQHHGRHVPGLAPFYFDVSPISTLC